MLGADGRSLASGYGGAELCPEYSIHLTAELQHAEHQPEADPQKASAPMQNRYRRVDHSGSGY